MHAVIKTGGKQYRVQEGDVIKIEKLAGVEAGGEVIFEHVLAVGAGEDIKIGAPLVEGATVKASVIEQGRSRKIVVFKKKRRKDYRRKRGHRQYFTRVRIESVEA